MPKPKTGAWKAAERRVAAMFYTLRNRLSGSSGRDDESASDSKHPVLFIETKYRTDHAIRTLYDETAAKASAEKKVPIIALVSKRKPGFLLVLHIDHLSQIAHEVKLCMDHVDATEGFTCDEA